MNSKKFSKMSVTQCECLVEFVCKHKAMIDGKLTNNFTKTDKENLWGKLTEKLNSMHGPRRQKEEWKKTWYHYKCQVKSKSQERQRELTKTGGGPSKVIFLTPLEEKVLAILNPTSMYGANPIRESSVYKTPVTDTSIASTSSATAPSAAFFAVPSISAAAPSTSAFFAVPCTSAAAPSTSAAAPLTSAATPSTSAAAPSSQSCFSPVQSELATVMTETGEFILPIYHEEQGNEHNMMESTGLSETLTAEEFGADPEGLSEEDTPIDPIESERRRRKSKKDVVFQLLEEQKATAAAHAASAEALKAVAAGLNSLVDELSKQHSEQLRIEKERNDLFKKYLEILANKK